MTIRREDLLAAAEAGVVQYSQIDHILIFLLNRDIQSQRSAVQTRRRSPRRTGLYYMLAMLAIGTALALIAWSPGLYGQIALQAHITDRLMWPIGLCALFAVAIAAWFERRRAGLTVRVLAAAVIALVPLALFLSQRMVVQPGV
ncbi:MAG: hypothetical protein JWQ23_974 [Herminiimonas sp.]|jgi:hypothetical protein|nr:hypothetical protein [Herminiimonas sp.]